VCDLHTTLARGPFHQLAKALICIDCGEHPKVYFMAGVPTQVPWRRFVCVLRKLGYSAQKGKAGAARSFTNPNRMPKVISLREPHPGKNLGATVLRKYLRQLLLNEDEFLRFLEDC